jgi:hypothetical protein
MNHSSFPQLAKGAKSRDRRVLEFVQASLHRQPFRAPALQFDGAKEGGADHVVTVVCFNSCSIWLRTCSPNARRAHSGFFLEVVHRRHQRLKRLVENAGFWAAGGVRGMLAWRRRWLRGTLLPVRVSGSIPKELYSGGCEGLQVGGRA